MIPNDEKILESYKKGNDVFLKYVIDTYMKILYNFIRRFGFNNEEAEDILQGIFIKVWKHIDNFDEEKSAFKTWIFTIAKNTIYDSLRKKKNKIIVSSLNGVYEDGNEIEFEDISKDIIKILEKKENRKILLKAIDELDFEEKNIILLHFEEGMTFTEIGEITNLKMNTVKSKYRRAIIKLKNILQKSNTSQQADEV